ncbi:MAG: elongation factor P [bacterium]|nr:elongation factor P [bacterium]
MLTYNDLKTGTVFVLDGEPYEVLSYEFLRMQQRKPVAKTKIRNLINGKIVERNFHQSESFEEAEIDKVPIKYLYNHRDEYWFCDKDNPAHRFSLSRESLGSQIDFVKPNSEVLSLKFGEKFIGIKPPIKVDLEVKETPPGERGDTATGGKKAAILETGAVVQVPLFINIGDVIRVNSESGEYVERAEKSK